ncbi:molybdopterin-guanine dinucleotide biosynthesis protein [Streptomyces sp. NP160]|uniref:NTP transferase domain-containing protein n=1 Tax=Streptomyces sp. NP160 TaxID=2586637 RepID=UPI00111BC78F|nr:NTP transferase domain-containing protein [Streptomyces sp. NP160]TNM69352.1 molybdopterin-guanine dinucleotide biosynthesis protein [Streptomyces sp. NP160]
MPTPTDPPAGPDTAALGPDGPAPTGAQDAAQHAAQEPARGLAWGVVVPAGGTGSRLGGADKPALLLDGRGLLEHLLDGLPAGVPAALVGPPRQLALQVGRPVLWCREEPPGGGPAAALAAGVAALGVRPPGAGGQDGRDGPAVVVVLPGDAPHAAAAVPVLLDALAGTPGRPPAATAVAVDGGGRRQVLVAAHRAGALARRVAALGGQRGLAGLAAARLLPSGEDLVEVPVAEGVLADVDAPGDLERLEQRERLRRAGGAGPA